ncbi:ABC transporter ATP-binding protein [Yersinia nurmii]|uniref:ABC transporter ATP-binding protein n=1 Tax=Yersinia nurmii TaxID=685706 RepID=A0AAW7JYN6_9GAMM|nr:ABC transporter ATP-binding protein [Yersinia nurmii]MDN0087928.1 ABC transporter ATP-binding protein [Yersinia nurmii]CND97315.1 ATP-binding transport protein [Yersinia nurmii]
MINIERLTLIRGEKTLFERLSLQIEKGSVTAILGANGRGKTTLLRLIMGAIKPTSGLVSVAANIGYVPQQENAVFPYSVSTMVMLGRVRHMGWFTTPNRRDSEVTQRCLDCFGLSPLADKPVNQLSGGERQLVSIARALASEPEILILDEPASALDLSNQDKVLSGLRDLSARLGMTVVFTTHSPLHALHIADRVLLLYPQADGQDPKATEQTKGVAFGPTRQVVTDKNLTQLYQLPIHVDKLDFEGKARDILMPLFN